MAKNLSEIVEMCNVDFETLIDDRTRIFIFVGRVGSHYTLTLPPTEFFFFEWVGTSSKNPGKSTFV
jgi:hypothetical protein